MDPRVGIALGAAAGLVLLGAGLLRWRQRRRMHMRLRTLAVVGPEDTGWSAPGETGSLVQASTASRSLVGKVGQHVAARWPAQAGAMAARVDRAGLAGGITVAELLGWKAFSAVAGLVLGLIALVRYGWFGLLMLVVTGAVGWFGVDLALARLRQVRRRAILRDLPTVMDLLVLSLQAGMGIERALRTIVHEYHSPASDEIKRVIADVELGVGRAEAFERMAARIGLGELHALARAIIQAEELGVSLVGAMEVQSHEVRLARRRAAETEALRAPIKMLFPLVVCILPTLFLLLLGPLGLRAAAALGGLGR